MGTKTNNALLSLHREMDRFEAVYLELHTHMASKIPPTPDLIHTHQPDHFLFTNSSDSLVHTSSGLVQCQRISGPETVTQSSSAIHNSSLHHARDPCELVQEGIHHHSIDSYDACQAVNQESPSTNSSNTRIECSGVKAWRFSDGRGDSVVLGAQKTFSALNDQTSTSISPVLGKDQGTCEELWFYLTAISPIFNRMRYFLVSEYIAFSTSKNA